MDFSPFAFVVDLAAYTWLTLCVTFTSVRIMRYLLECKRERKEIPPPYRWPDDEIRITSTGFAGYEFLQLGFRTMPSTVALGLARAPITPLLFLPLIAAFIGLCGMVLASYLLDRRVKNY